ncbi:hypothetical protein TRFO_41218 [Tritrichomonas foetus]|uniref:Repressor of RNA polymerase III transcription n=1 Tax=Tritrichomonas foetus TaxID=1144522 RepID=A0A1J4L5C4_9EUKA|nr:hypothetical protein TRFO_41218 [Tritrichomonas foetus]|eukprot:OHT17188.1 hypothetical protein TRFO_41218 [Tritrichomonas foetus]
MKWYNSNNLCNTNQELMSLCSSSHNIFGQIECYSFDQKEYPAVGNVEAMFRLLKNTIETSFPDFDFSWLIHQHFKIVESSEEAQSNIGWTVISNVPSSQAILSNLWAGIEKEIQPSNCMIYAYEPNCTDAFSELGALWTVSYLFVNLKMRKILHFHMREGASSVEQLSDVDISMDEDMELECYNYC